MTAPRTPQEHFEAARKIAQEHGMFVVDKGDRFLLFRRNVPRNVFLGKRSDPAALRRLVCKIAGKH